MNEISIFADEVSFGLRFPCSPKRLGPGLSRKANKNRAGLITFPGIRDRFAKMHNSKQVRAGKFDFNLARRKAMTY